MVAQTAPLAPETVRTWLEDVGFSRGNPFRYTAADQERAYLREALFVEDVPGYDEIRNRRTILVFAPRGGGKSSFRVRLAALALPERADADTLVVECTDFSAFLPQVRAREPITEEAIMAFLLRQAGAALLESFFVFAVHSREPSVREKEAQARAGLAGRFDALARARLARLLRRFAPDALAPMQLFQFMRRLDNGWQGEWPAFRAAARKRVLRPYLAQTSLAGQAVAHLLADLNDEPDEDLPGWGPLAWLQELVSLARSGGIDQVHFLVDRLDEMQVLAHDFAAQADILEPLLAFLPLLELPGLGFKFFIAQELGAVLRQRPAIREDRLLINHALTIQWDEAALTKLLHGRLRFFSEGGISSLVALCAQGSEQVEPLLVETAMGSPRRLLLAGQLLLDAHMAGENRDGLLTMADWEQARDRLLALMPPALLILDLPQRKVFIGVSPVELTANEAGILQVLAAAGGTATRDEIAEQVWGAKEGVTDAAIDQACNRLRRKIEPNPQNPVYLHTLHGVGFRLSHFKLSE